MIDFSPAWIYRMAEALTKLAMTNKRVPLSHFVHVLPEGRSETQAFISHEQHILFPETREAAKDVLVWINVILPPTQPFSDRIVGYDEIVGLLAAINQTVATFEAECGRVYIVGLERQRALEPKTLVEAIENAVSPECWKRLSRATKREIEECGCCLAFERYTASGFHLLRAIEAEVRDYIFLILRAAPERRDLGHYIQVLRDNGADPKLISVLENIGELDRNPLMHPEDWLSKDDAIDSSTLPKPHWSA